MSSNAIFFGWNRAIPGREQISGAHFQEFVEYCQGLQKEGTIQSFEAVILDSHGGDMNGFFLIRGDPARLDGVQASPEWVQHMTRALLHLENSGAIRAATGILVAERMGLWQQHIPK